MFEGVYSYKGYYLNISSDSNGYSGSACGIYFICKEKKKVHLKRKFRLFVKEQYKQEKSND